MATVNAVRVRMLGIRIMFVDKPIRLDWDERREVYRLIDRLDKRDRIGFLKWACRQVSHGNIQTQVGEQSGETQEVFWDAMMLAFNHGISLETLGKELIRVCHLRGK